MSSRFHDRPNPKYRQGSENDIFEMLKLIKQNFIKFIILWLLILLASFFILSFFGLVPDEKETVQEERIDTPEEVLEQKLSRVSPATPERVLIREIGVDVSINNPNSTNIDVLDQSLQSGAVRYPTSGLLGEKTNILLFGHSSNWPVVRNQNYKAFNNIENLEIGDTISVFSETHEFIYSVTSSEEASAENALVVFESNKREITLSTCNTFGDLSDRFVVKAELVDIKEITL